MKRLSLGVCLLLVGLVAVAQTRAQTGPHRKIFAAGPCTSGPITIVNTSYFSNPGEDGTGTFSIATTTAGNLLVVMTTTLIQNSHWSPPQYLSANNDTLQEVPFYGLSGNFPFNAAYDFASWPGSDTSADIWWTVSKGGTNTLSYFSGDVSYYWVYELSGASSWTVGDFEMSGAAGTAMAPVVGPVLSGAGARNTYFSVVSTFLGNTTAVASPWTLDGNPIQGNAPAYILNSTGNRQATFTDSHGNDQFTIGGILFRPCA